MGLLSNKRALVVGIANKRSMAWGIAQALEREGAELALTYQNDRLRQNLDKLVPELVRPPLMAPLDVTQPDSVPALKETLQNHWPDGLDILVHSIANADRRDLEGRFVETSREGFLHALDVSAYSLTLVTQGLLELLTRRPSASVMTLTYQGSVRVKPNYNVMGVAKAALESSVRYLAYDLGRDRVRVNAISAGPVKTLAASGVRGISAALEMVTERAPIPENITTDDIGNAAVFLASDWSRRITGQILFVDSGMHVMG